MQCRNAVPLQLYRTLGVIGMGHGSGWNIEVCPQRLQPRTAVKIAHRSPAGVDIRDLVGHHLAVRILQNLPHVLPVLYESVYVYRPLSRWIDRGPVLQPIGRGRIDKPIVGYYQGEDGSIAGPLLMD